MENHGVHFMMPTIFNDKNEIDLDSMNNICEFAKKSNSKQIFLILT